MIQDEYISDITLDGFQVVRGQYFSRSTGPMLTIWNTSISFNPPSHAALTNCEAIQIMVNEKDRRILVLPTSSSDSDSVKWNRETPTPKSTKLECSLFTLRLYENWHWNAEIRYRAGGRLVKKGKKLMLLFDFNHPEMWKGLKMVRIDD